MKHSTDRIRVSHAGNLPRPRYLDELIEGGKNRDGSHTGEYHNRLPKGVQEIVDKQIELGVDVVNDGEYAKAGSYGGYMQERVSGYSSVPVDPNRKPKRSGTAERDRQLFPGFYASGLWFSGSGGPVRPGFATPGEVRNTNLREARACTGPVKYTGQAAVAEDIKNLKAALAGKPTTSRATSRRSVRSAWVLASTTSTTPAKRSTCRRSPTPVARSTRRSPTRA